jgi:hypothetical protein
MVNTHVTGSGFLGRRSWLTVAASAVAAGAILLRIVSIAEPLGIDQGLWASAVRGLARGQLLYRDVWEQRPPGIYLLYWWACQLLGWTSSSIVWLDILASAATTALVYLIARQLGSRLTGAVAAALYAALTMPAWLYKSGEGILERSVCETFIVVSVGMAAWCAVRFRDRPSTPLALLIGLFAGAAVVFEPNAGLYLPALLLWMVLYGTGRSRLALMRPIGLAVLASTVVPALAFLWLWRLGVLDDARVAVIDFNRFYVTQGFTIAGEVRNLYDKVGFRVKYDPLWFVGAVGGALAIWDLARKRRLGPLPGLAILWGGAASLVIIVNGVRLFNSYFIQAMAPLALLGAWLVTEALGASWFRRALAAAAVSWMAFLLVDRHYATKVLGSARADFNQLVGRSDRVTYLDRFGAYGGDRGYSARANEELAAYVRAHTTVDEKIFLFGINGASVYFLADRLPAHRFLRVNFFVAGDFPDPRFRIESVVRDLSASRPRYMIFERLPNLGPEVNGLPQHPDVRRLLDEYQLEAQIEDFTVYRRK